MEQINKPQGFIKITITNKKTGTTEIISIKNMVVQSASSILANNVARTGKKRVTKAAFGLTDHFTERDDLTALWSATKTELELEETYFVDINREPVDIFSKNGGSYLVKGICFCFKTENIPGGTKVTEVGLFADDDTMFSYKPINNFITPPDSIVSVEWTIMF